MGQSTFSEKWRRIPGLRYFSDRLTRVSDYVITGSPEGGIRVIRLTDQIHLHMHKTPLDVTLAGAWNSLRDHKYRLKRKEQNKSREEIFYQMKGFFFVKISCRKCFFANRPGAHN